MTYENEPLKAGHYLSEIDPTRFDHSLPILAVIAIMLTTGIFQMVQHLTEEVLGKADSDHVKEVLEVENLPSFYETLYKSDIDQWIKEELAVRNINVSFIHFNLKNIGLPKIEGLQLRQDSNRQY
jgi:hypothetical protein